MKARVLTKIRLSEISAVDNPAQAPAKIVLLKRAIENPAIGGGKPEESKNMDEKQKQAAEQAALEKKLQETQAELAVALVKAGLSDAEKQHLSSLPADGQAAFLKSDSGTRKRLVDAAREADPVVYTSLSGETFRKSDSPRIVDLAKRLDAAETLAKAERDAREASELRKRAQEELNKLPGSEVAKVALLKAVSGIPDKAQREEVEALLKAAQSAGSIATTMRGTAAGADDKADDPEAKLEKMAQELAAKKNIDYFTAYNEVIDSPAGVELQKQLR